MGFDVNGKKRGTYFHASIHSWPVILGFTRHACPDAARDEVWEQMAYNDGVRVCAVAAARMADAVEAALAAAGTCSRFVLQTDVDTGADAFCRMLLGRRAEHAADRGHLEEWVAFLRECRGVQRMLTQEKTMGLFNKPAVVEKRHPSGIPFEVVQAIEAACFRTGVNTVIGYEGVETLSDGPLWISAVAERFKQAQYECKRAEEERDAALAQVKALTARVKELETNRPTPEQAQAAVRQRVMDAFGKKTPMAAGAVVNSTGLLLQETTYALMQLFKEGLLEYTEKGEFALLKTTSQPIG